MQLTVADLKSLIEEKYPDECFEYVSSLLHSSDVIMIGTPKTYIFGSVLEIDNEWFILTEVSTGTKPNHVKIMFINFYGRRLIDPIEVPIDKNRISNNDIKYLSERPIKYICHVSELKTIKS